MDGAGDANLELIVDQLRILAVGVYWCRSGSRSDSRCRAGAEEAAGAGPRRPTPLAQALHRFKFRGDRYAGHCLVRLFADCMTTRVIPPQTLASRGREGDSGPAGYDAIVPVPLSSVRLRSRRFNQSAWLARGLARRGRIAYRPGWLTRSGQREVQHQLGVAARRSNVDGTFESPAAHSLAVRSAAVLPPHATVLLVDDVCTTGSTLAEAARVLRSNGVARVDAAVLILTEEGNVAR